MLNRYTEAHPSGPGPGVEVGREVLPEVRVATDTDTVAAVLAFDVASAFHCGKSVRPGGYLYESREIPATGGKLRPEQ